jgi:hypothetical protein
MAQRDKFDSAALRGLMDDLAARHGLAIRAAATGLGKAGGLDLGSPSLAPLKHPRVALLTGPGATSTVAGDLWHQFDQEWRASLVMIESGQIDAVLLGDFDCLILPEVSFTSLPAAAIQNWVSSGGSLIAIGAVSSLAGQEWVKAAMVKAEFPAGEAVPYEKAEAAQAARQVKGAIVRATFDATHPLAYGFAGQGGSIALFRSSATCLAPPANPHLAPLRHPGDPLVAGFVAAPNLKALAGSVPIVVVPSGSGRVILFADNPVFRGHWHGSAKLLANALFFGTLVKAGGADAAKEPGDEGGH